MTIDALMQDVQLLKDEILSIPENGSINLHLGKLPAYRGIFPTFHAFVNLENSFFGSIKSSSIVFKRNNDPDLLHFAYQRFLENRIREAFGFEGTAIRLRFRSRAPEGIEVPA